MAGGGRGPLTSSSKCWAALERTWTGEARPIPGNNIRETQSRIEQTIGMDYDSFINSAFLLQGRADEFTNKTPADRKAVLAKILGLEDYDRLQELAKRGLGREQDRRGGDGRVAGTAAP